MNITNTMELSLYRYRINGIGIKARQSIQLLEIDSRNETKIIVEIEIRN